MRNEKRRRDGRSNIGIIDFDLITSLVIEEMRGIVFSWRASTPWRRKPADEGQIGDQA
jgi:hypothetical protein